MKNLIILLLIPILFSACLQTKKIEIKGIKFIDDLNFDSQKKIGGILFGGISGLYYDKKFNLLYALSDDRGKFNSPHYFALKPKIEENKFNFEFDKIMYLQKDGNRYPKNGLDPEGITRLTNNNIVIASEGNFKKGDIVQPGVFEYSKNGNLLYSYKLPKKYHYHEDGLKGPRSNLSFEALTLSDDKAKTYMYVGLENALIQDGPIADMDTHSMTRILRFTRGHSGYNLTNEFAYPLSNLDKSEKIQSSQANKSLGVNGLVELLALSPWQLIALERGYNPKTKENFIKLFSFEIDEEVSDLIKNESLKEMSVKPIRKKLLLDLSTITDQFEEGYQVLDNYEAMTLGPKLPNGNPSIIIASDNNFNKRQRTSFLLFELLL